MNKLIENTITILKEKNIQYDHNILGIACAYYYKNLSRVEVFESLKKEINNLNTISTILNIYDCMKDPNKVPFEVNKPIVTALFTNLKN